MLNAPGQQAEVDGVDDFDLAADWMMFTCEDALMRYFRRLWDEDRGDEYAAWGTSTYYLAIDSAGEIRQQVEVYANGNVLAYDDEHDEDRYGFLSYAILDLDEFAPFEISELDFQKALGELAPLNRERV